MKTLTSPYRSQTKKAIANLAKTAVSVLFVLVLSAVIAISLFADGGDGYGSGSGSGTPPGTDWGDDQLILQVVNENVPPDVEIGGTNFDYRVGAGETIGNHLPTNPYSRRTTEPGNGNTQQSLTTLDFSAVEDADGDNLEWEFSYHNLTEVGWDPNTKTLTVDGLDGEVIVTARDLRSDGTRRSSGVSFIETVAQP